MLLYSSTWAFSLGSAALLLLAIGEILFRHNGRHWEIWLLMIPGSLGTYTLSTLILEGTRYPRDGWLVAAELGSLILVLPYALSLGAKKISS